MMSHSRIATADCRRIEVHIVDDDEAVRASLSLLASAQGWQSHAYASASEFLEAAERVDPASCLVLDLQMPGMDGALLRETLLANGVAIPTVVLTAWPSGKLADRALQAGAQEVIAKPFTAGIWVQAVKRALGNRDP